jgi:hypothetical protein
MTPVLNNQQQMEWREFFQHRIAIHRNACDKCNELRKIQWLNKESKHHSSDEAKRRKHLYTQAERDLVRHLTKDAHQRPSAAAIWPLTDLLHAGDGEMEQSFEGDLSEDLSSEEDSDDVNSDVPDNSPTQQTLSVGLADNSPDSVPRLVVDDSMLQLIQTGGDRKEMAMADAVKVGSVCFVLPPVEEGGWPYYVGQCIEVDVGEEEFVLQWYGNVDDDISKNLQLAWIDTDEDLVYHNVPNIVSGHNIVLKAGNRVSGFCTRKGGTSVYKIRQNQVKSQQDRHEQITSHWS